MICEEGRARKKTLIEFIEPIMEICAMANESGAVMRFMNDHRGERGWTGRSREDLEHHGYGGLARIGTALKRRILDIFVMGNHAQSKPLLVLIVTGGMVGISLKTLKAIITIRKKVEGERKGHLKNVIRDCLNEREGAGKGFDG